MQQQNEKQTSESSDSSFSKMSLRFVKEDLREIVDKLYEMSRQMKGDKELSDQLRWRSDDVEEILNEIYLREENVDELINSIAD